MKQFKPITNSNELRSVELWHEVYCSQSKNINHCFALKYRVRENSKKNHSSGMHIACLPTLCPPVIIIRMPGQLRYSVNLEIFN